MQTLPVSIARKQARELYRKYKIHAHHTTPIDNECRRAYQLLAQGRLIIKALESIKDAGVKTEGIDIGFPKLAICRADAVSCNVRLQRDGSCIMRADDTQVRHRGHWSGPIIQSRNVFEWPAGSFHFLTEKWRGSALVPMPPIYLRPKRGLANYHVLWEAEWTKIPPHDPLLLRRIGRADLWLVVAQWNLTDVERAALATRIGA